MTKTATDPQAEILKRGCIPAHVAIIMDGNGRWAKRRLLPRIEGHRAGTKSVRRALETSRLLGVRCLTLYTFSLENWERPRAEVDELMRLLRQHLLGEKDRLIREGISLRAAGELKLLPAEVRSVLDELTEATAGGHELRFTLALSYGSRQEIVGAAIAAIARHGGAAKQSRPPQVKIGGEGGAAKQSRPPEVEIGGEGGAAKQSRPPEVEIGGEGGDPALLDAAALECHLLTAGLPPVDLLIRTSGEHRLSNFLLWQAQGAYLHFTPTLWPAFGKASYFQAVRAWQGSLESGIAAPPSPPISTSGGRDCFAAPAEAAS